MHSNTDGIFSCTYLGDKGRIPFFLLLECKLDVDFNNIEDRSAVLVQVIAYLAQIHISINNTRQQRFRFEIAKIPSVILVGSKKNCFALASKSIEDYYTRNFDFDSLSSASKFKKTPEGELIYNQLCNDTTVNRSIIVLEVAKKSGIRDIANFVYRYAKGQSLADDLSNSNLSLAFDMFVTEVLTPDTSDSLSNRKKAELFAQFVINPGRIQVNTSLLGEVQSVTVNATRLDVNTKGWYAFQVLYNLKQYNTDEQKKITAITDTLLEDNDRRRKGDFYTPKIWVDKAHELISKHLGDDWKLRDNLIVWDCAWGTGNLTRDYLFKNLYCSTLHQEDLEIGQRYNVKATKFQYDFLNDDVEEFESVQYLLWQPFKGTQFYMNKQVEKFINFKDILELYANAIEKGVITEDQAKAWYSQAVDRLKNTELYSKAPGLIDGLLEGKELLFFINPPYAASTNVKSTTLSGESKDGTNDTAIRNLMSENKIGAASQNLYTQFIYRIDVIIKLFGNKSSLGIFCPPAYLSGKNAKILRKELGIWVIDSFLLQASQFANVSEGWGISFQLLTQNNEQREYTKTNIKVVQDGVVVDLGTKIIYNMDNKDNLSNWIRRNIKQYKAIDAPQMKSALNWSNTHKLGNLVPGSIGYLVDSGNNVDENTSRVFWLTCCRGAGHGTSVLKENFDDCCSAFAARKLIAGEYATWINCKDEYMIPNINHPSYKQWEIDCIVYSLFNTSSNQSSLRNIEYNGKLWNIENQFFWVPVDAMDKTIQSTPGADAVYEDLQLHFGKRFVTDKIQEIENSDTLSFSEDAKQILDLATEIVYRTLQYRAEFNKQHPEYHINTWDAGWYQIKALAKQYLPNELKAFNELYKQFSDRLRPLVYELGFLYK